MKRFAAVAFLCVVSGGALAEDSWLPVESVRARAAEMLQGYRPVRPFARTVQANVEDRKGVTNPVPFESRTLYIPQPNGLLSIEGRGNSKFGPTTYDRLSICGLIAIYSVATQPLVMPMGNMTQEVRTRVTALETPTPTLCSPAPGERIAYRAELEMQILRHGSFAGSPRSITGTAEMSCTVGKEFRRASEYGEGLEGMALPVDCTKIWRSGTVTQDSEVHFAFLPDSGLYLLLKERTPVAETTARLLEVKYRQ